MSVFKDDMTTYTGNVTILGSLNIGGALVVTGSITGGSIIVGGNPIVAATPITNSLGADVLLNNTANYFDGPSVAQGSTGTWFVSGTVVVSDTAGGDFFSAKLWDGTNIIASARIITAAAANTPGLVALSGFQATPAGNLRISVKCELATTGKILFNQSGNSKDSTISAIRIA